MNFMPGAVVSAKLGLYVRSRFKFLYLFYFLQEFLHVHHSVEVPPEPEHCSPQRFHWSLRKLRQRPSALRLHLRPRMGHKVCLQSDLLCSILQGLTIQYTRIIA